MNRAHHLTYCKICTHRKHDFKYGIICDLTNARADFDLDCPTFNLDTAELNVYRERIKADMDETYHTNFIEDLLGDPDFIRPTEYGTTKYKSVEKTHKLKFKNNVLYDKFAIGLNLFAMVYIFFVNYKDIVNGTLAEGVSQGFVVLFGLLVVFIYRAFFMTHKVKIKVSKTGITYYGKTVYWNSILDVGIVKAQGARFNEHKVVLGTLDQGIVEMDLATLNVSPMQLVDIIALNAKYVKP